MTTCGTIQVDVKRCLDVAIAATALIVAWPVLVAIAIVVRADSHGPALYRQTRVGRRGTTFRIHKFRTMRVHHDGQLVSATGDGRVTRVGRILRKSKLDELPQIFDILAGHMSLVGPRPEVPEYVAMWPADRRRLILSVRPGVTDPASIALRNESDELAAASDPHRHYVESLLPRKTQWYVEYVTHRTLRGDLKILLQTARAITAGRTNKQPPRLQDLRPDGISKPGP